MHNRATIYSNGIADFQRVFSVQANQTNQISIPVRQQHLGDVLASLTISGPVKIESPPSYQPANQDDGNIVIATDDVIVSLANQLSGSDVEIAFADRTIAGKLVGIHENQVATGGERIVEKQLVVLTDQGLTRVSIQQIENLQFVDATVQSEIDKALSRRLRDIKPNSTFVDLKLTTEENSAQAIIQYTIPAAAWKITYRVLIHDAEQIEFHGHAIVDNNTDEDWKDFVISVVMGQPITFTTDLADSKTPRRSHVNIVQESAFGAVEVEAPMLMAMAPPNEKSFIRSAMDSVDSERDEARVRAKRMSKAAPQRAPSAVVDEAEIGETGDFCIFQSASPVSIDAHRSAVIPVFATTINESKPVLHFKTSNHPERPFRALRFTNTTPHSLGRGVCTVYDGTTYAGNCILPATKPGGDALLPHALETAIRVRVTNVPEKSRRVGIRIADGVAYDSRHHEATTEFLINSDRDETFEFLFDHDLRIQHSQFEVHLTRDGADSARLETESLKEGCRVKFELEPRDIVTIKVIESRVQQSRIHLSGVSADAATLNTRWLYENVVESNSVLANEPAIRECMDLRKRLDEQETETRNAHDEIERLTKRQIRLRENIKTGNADQQTRAWQSDLAKAEEKIVRLEETKLPQLQSETATLKNQLYNALKNLALEWTG